MLVEMENADRSRRLRERLKFEASKADLRRGTSTHVPKNDYSSDKELRERYLKEDESSTVITECFGSAKEHATSYGSWLRLARERLAEHARGTQTSLESDQDEHATRQR